MASLNPPVRNWTSRTVWIVGASSGIGRALAAQHDVANRPADEGELVAGLCEARGQGCEGLGDRHEGGGR